MVRIIGIVNVTRDSFSDGGRFLSPRAAIDHALELAADGADLIDLGAESSHPDAEDVPADVQIERLTPVIERLKCAGLCVSVDTHRPAVMRRVLGLGADVINDITGFGDPEAVATVRDSDARLIVMHSRASRARAERRAADPETIVDEICVFFRERVAFLQQGGVARERLILDPGMGFFLSSNSDASLAVLRGLDRIAALGLPLCVSTSRKSFVGALLADADGRPRPVAERGVGTLASEIWAVRQGARYIRTHDVRALRDALRVLESIRSPAHVGAE
jgi:dihydropteroate synthase